MTEKNTAVTDFKGVYGRLKLLCLGLWHPHMKVELIMDWISNKNICF